MNEPYLILHKVRGEPAFDIAERVGEDSDGEIWIIPTSGHRAYPYEAMKLGEMEHRPTGWVPTGEWFDWVKEVKMNHEWPDHYSCNDRPIRHEVKPSSRPRPQPTVNDLMELLK